MPNLESKDHRLVRETKKKIRLVSDHNTRFKDQIPPEYTDLAHSYSAALVKRLEDLDALLSEGELFDELMRKRWDLLKDEATLYVGVIGYLVDVNNFFNALRIKVPREVVSE